MNRNSGKPLRLFVNPFAVWTDVVLKTGEAMLASMHAAAARATRPKVAVIPPAEPSTPAPRKVKVKVNAKHRLKPKAKTAAKAESKTRKRRAKKR